MRVLAVLIGFAIFAADLITKGWVKSIDPSVFPIVVLEDFIRIRFVVNTGVAFGWFQDVESEWKSVILSALALLGVIVVFYYIWTTPGGPRRHFVSLGLLLGGILGNFTDRLLNEHVVDFLEFHWKDTFTWPTFNVADSAITCGVILILFETFFGKEEGPASVGSDPE